MLIADVDCTAAGEEVCQRFGVQGYPTIKSFQPPDEEGEDYEGSRDIEELREFAKGLGPGCTVLNKEFCSEEELAELEEALRTPIETLAAELAEIKAKLKKAEDEHEELEAELERRYDESEEALEELKNSLKPRLKVLKAATASTHGGDGGDDDDKDEV